MNSKYEIKFAEKIRERPGMFFSNCDRVGIINFLFQFFNCMEHLMLWKELKVNYGKGDIFKFEYDNSLKFDEVINNKGLFYDSNFLYLIPFCEIFELNFESVSLSYEKGRLTNARSRINEKFSAEFKFDKEIFDEIGLVPTVLKNALTNFINLSFDKKNVLLDVDNVLIVEIKNKGFAKSLKKLELFYLRISPFFEIKYRSKDLILHTAFYFSNINENNILSYTQYGKSNLGGTHEKGLVNGINQSIKEIKTEVKRDLYFVAILKINYRNLKFLDSTRQKVGDKDLTSMLSDIVFKELCKNKLYFDFLTKINL